MSYKQTYSVNELSCPSCAEHVIESLEKLCFIDEVFIDYDEKKVTIKSKKPFSEEQAKLVIQDLLSYNHCNEHNYTHFHNIVTEEFDFDDIDCPNCASKVERALNKENNILDAQVNFLNKKIIIKHLNNVEVYDVVSKIVSNLENKAKVYKESEHHQVHKTINKNSYLNRNFNLDSNSFKKAKVTKKEDVIKTSNCRCHHDHNHFDSCSLDKNQKKMHSIKGLDTAILIIGVVLYIVSLILHFTTDYKFVYYIFIVSYIFISYDLLYSSFKAIIHLDIFNENFLMIIASIGALIINEPVEAIMVILLFKIGEYLQTRATDKSKKSIQSLLEIKSQTVTLETGEIKDVKDVSLGDIITVKVGERIPLDGVVLSEGVDVDMSSLTGESRPVYIDEGNEILSGSINLNRVVRVEVTKLDSDSTLTKMVKLVEEASNQKSTTERFITKFARVYTPLVLIAALLIGLIKGLIFDKSFSDVLNGVLSILVISCPCALVISIPLGYFAGIGRLSSLGILVKGGNYLDALSKTKTFVFDKTGTLTKGNFEVCEINPVSGITNNELMDKIINAERYSNHPIAQSILTSYTNELKKEEDTQIEEISGHGLRVSKVNEEILVGNESLMEKYGILYTKQNSVGTILYVASNKKYMGNIVIRDTLKETSKNVIEKLNKEYETIMLTGDTFDVANLVADELGIKSFKSELLPKQKYELIKNIIKESHDKNKKHKVCYVGDGINDSPAIKISDVGIAMGGCGSDQAKETADIVIMNDDLDKIVEALKISKFTRKIIHENIFLSLVVKIAALIVGVLGVLGSYAMLVAVFADAGICLLAIVNTLRILKAK